MIMIKDKAKQYSTRSNKNVIFTLFFQLAGRVQIILAREDDAARASRPQEIQVKEPLWKKSRKWCPLFSTTMDSEEEQFIFVQRKTSNPNFTDQSFSSTGAKTSNVASRSVKMRMQIRKTFSCGFFRGPPGHTPLSSLSPRAETVRHTSAVHLSK
jgi:hypothetical protein